MPLAVALAQERAFAIALGGFVLECSGGFLTTHERIAVPRFNYADVDRVAIDRQAGFFERALDHYFQRAIRPSFRVPRPEADHVGRTLRGLAFQPRAEPLVALVAPPLVHPRPNLVGVAVEDARTSDGEELAALWTAERERDEFRRALEVILHHPNDGERLLPLVARSGGSVVGSALVYQRGSVAGIHAVSTRPAARGHGVATAIVEAALHRVHGTGAQQVVLLTENPRLADHLAPLGFAEVGRLTSYDLPDDAELAFVAPPPGPPRWRPPRGGGGPTTTGPPVGRRRA